MKLARVLCSLSLAALVVIGPRARSQANVVENQTAVLYVDAHSGSDANSGASSSPLKTIQAAVNKANINNQKSIGTRIIVDAGIYRETVSVNPVSGQTSAALTIQAATNGTAIIAASDLISAWSTDPQYSGAYVANWTPAQSTCALPSGWPALQPIALHTEMLFLNGIAMTQVLNYSDLKPGTFFVGSTDGTLHLWPPSGTEPSNATIEVASRAKTISIVGRSNIVLRGLVFEHAASCINTSGATVTSSSNVLVDSVQANWNNWGGLGISSSSNITVQNSMASYNGGVGFQGTRDQAALYTGNETDYNNWRGAEATLYNWASGGAKFFQMRTTSVQGHLSYNNQAQGLWFDTDNQNITINNATLVGSYNAALQLERNEGPVTLENSHLCSSGVGVNVLNTQELTVDNNVFYNNGATNKYQAQFYLAGTAGGISTTNWQTGQVYNLVTTGTTMSGNEFIDALPGQYVFGTYVSGTDWTDFTSTVKSSFNTWYDPGTPNAFRIANGKNVDLAGWQTATGADYNSTWAEPSASPASSCAPPSAAYPDLNVSVDSGSYTMTSGLATANVRVNSFNFGAVNLSVSGLPTGVTASFSNQSLTNGYSTLTLTASSTSTAQTVPVTLWAISGDRVHSATFNLTVTANPGRHRDECFTLLFRLDDHARHARHSFCSSEASKRNRCSHGLGHLLQRRDPPRIGDALFWNRKHLYICTPCWNRLCHRHLRRNDKFSCIHFQCHSYHREFCRSQHHYDIGVVLVCPHAECVCHPLGDSEASQWRCSPDGHRDVLQRHSLTRIRDALFRNRKHLYIGTPRWNRLGHCRLLRRCLLQGFQL